MTNEPIDKNTSRSPSKFLIDAMPSVEGTLHMLDKIAQDPPIKPTLPLVPHNSPDVRHTPDATKTKRRTWPHYDSGRRLFSQEARKTGDFRSANLNLRAKLELPNKLRILIVDDEKVNRLILERNTQRALNNCDKNSFVIEQAENGQLAVEKFQQAKTAGEPYHVIIMDNTMPVMTGSDAIRDIRPQDDKVLFLIHTTDDAATRDNMLALASPRAIGLAKPCPPEKLNQVFLNVVNDLIRGKPHFDLSQALASLSAQYAADQHLNPSVLKTTSTEKPKLR